METISMSRKERKRLEAFSRVKMGGMTLVEASELLGLSYRQTKRAWSRYQSEGDAGLVHRLRGRAPKSAFAGGDEAAGRWRCIASSMPITGRPWRRNAWRRKTA